MRSDREYERITETLECLDIDITDCSKIAAGIGDEFLVYLLDMAILHVRRRAVRIDKPKDTSARTVQTLHPPKSIAPPSGRRPAALGRRTSAQPTAGAIMESVPGKRARADTTRRIVKDAELSSGAQQRPARDLATSSRAAGRAATGAQVSVAAVEYADG